MSSFSEKNRRAFAWKCFVWEQLLLDLAHLEIPILSTAVYFRAHKRKYMIHHLSRCHRRVSKHRDFFWAIDKLTTRTNFFDSQMFMQYWTYAGPTNAYGCLNLTIGHIMFLQYQLAHSINHLQNNNWIWTTFTKFVLEWIHHTINKDGASLPKTELSSSMHCCWVNPRQKL